jgi:hypothetical protein
LKSLRCITFDTSQTYFAARLRSAIVISITAPS